MMQGLVWPHSEYDINLSKTVAQITTKGTQKGRATNDTVANAFRQTRTTSEDTEVVVCIAIHNAMQTGMIPRVSQGSLHSIHIQKQGFHVTHVQVDVPTTSK